jgi:cytochrome b561
MSISCLAPLENHRMIVEGCHGSRANLTTEHRTDLRRKNKNGTPHFYPDAILMTSHDEVRYDTTTISLHWFTAVLVVVLWIIGQTADWLPRGALQTFYWSSHVALGFALAVILAWRMIWRGALGRRLPAADSGVLRLAAEASHGALYVLLVVVVGLGVVNAFVRGYDLFGLFHLPQIGDSALRRPITHWHGLAANILLGLALLHALAALAHHYVLKDAVLRRMAP